MQQPVQSSPFGIIDVLSKAVGYVKNERWDFLYLVTFPVIALPMLSTLMLVFSPDFILQVDPEQQIMNFGPGAIIIAVAFFLLISLFSVAWFRKCLIPDEQPSVAQSLKWDRYKTVHSVHLFLVTLVSVLGEGLVMYLLNMFTGTSAPLIAAIASYFVGLYLFARLCFLFPAAAIGHSTNWKTIWHLSKLVGWHLVAIMIAIKFAVMILVGFFLVVIVIPLAQLAGLQNSLTMNLIVGIVGLTIIYAMIAVGATAVSMAYRKMLDREQEV